MDGWRMFVLSLVAMSLTGAVVQQLLPDSGRKELVRILCGIPVAMVILQPLSRIDPEDLFRILPQETFAADPWLAEGAAAAEEAKKEYITQACEAYIWNKAKTLGAEIRPEIRLDEEGLPVFAQIQGTVDPGIQETLAGILATDLGITKENQRWTGNPASSG